MFLDEYISIDLSGKDESIKAALKIIGGYFGKRVIEINGVEGEFDLEHLDETIVSSGNLSIKTRFFWDNDMIFDDKIAIDVANASPDLFFSCELRGTGKYEDVHNQYNLRDGLLSIENCVDGNDDYSEFWIKKTMDKMSLSKFQELFMIGDIDEDIYMSLLELLAENECDFLSVEYDTLMELFDELGINSSLTEDEFDDISAKLIMLRVPDILNVICDYREFITVNKTYDAVNKCFV